MGTTRDVTTIGRIGESETQVAVVALHGEFDVFDLRPSRDTLGGGIRDDPKKGYL